MADSPNDNITHCLRRWHAGDQAAGDEVFRLLMPELQKIAARFHNRERRNYSLQRTELVNEIFFKLLDANRAVDWRDRAHFFAIFTIRLRCFLIDRARRKPTAELLSLEDLPEGIMAGRSRLEVRVAVDELLDELEKESPTTCAILISQAYFGLEVTEIINKFNLPRRTVERHLHEGRKWLFERLSKKR